MFACSALKTQRISSGRGRHEYLICNAQKELVGNITPEEWKGLVALAIINESVYLGATHSPLDDAPKPELICQHKMYCPIKAKLEALASR